MVQSRYLSPQVLLDSAKSWEDDLEKVVRQRMTILGVPERMIGLRGYPGIPAGRAFVRFHETQIGGNLNPALHAAWQPGIVLDHGILDLDHPRLRAVAAWKDRFTHLRDRVDAAIAHEYTETLLTPPPDKIGLDRVRWLHRESVGRAPETALPITRRAREILRQYRSAESV